MYNEKLPLCVAIFLYFCPLCPNCEILSHINKNHFQSECSQKELSGFHTMLTLQMNATKVTF